MGLLLLFAVGCSSAATPSLELVYLPNQMQPVPSADLPVDLRVKNWIGTNDRGSSGGSCFWASMWMCVRASGRTDIEEQLAERLNAGYEGPEHLLSMARKLDAIGVPFVATEDGDVRVLEEASRTRRWTAIGYYPGHAICFVGFYELTPQAVEQLQFAGVPIHGDMTQLAGQEVAILLDNNFPSKYIIVKDKQRFLRSWRELYGGIAITPWLSPIMPMTYPRTAEKSYARDY